MDAMKLFMAIPSVFPCHPERLSLSSRASFPVIPSGVEGSAFIVTDFSTSGFALRSK